MLPGKVVLSVKAYKSHKAHGSFRKCRCIGHWPMQSKSSGLFLDGDGPGCLEIIVLITVEV